jgi:hypothetical protein
MKDPEKAAALLVFPLVFAILGIVFSIKNATIVNVSVASQTFSSTLGNLYSSVAQGPGLPSSSQRISGACPGEDSCVPGAGAASDAACVPSSVWSLMIVNQFFASVAIVLQAAMTAALCARRGTRGIHQILGAIVVVLLLIAFGAVCGVPVRFVKVCAPSSINGISYTYALDFGGQLPFLVYFPCYFLHLILLQPPSSSPLGFFKSQALLQTTACWLSLTQGQMCRLPSSLCMLCFVP